MKKIVLGIFIALVALVAVGYFVWNEPLPEGKAGAEADTLASNMLKAINHKAWEATGAVQWSFPGGHEHLWDKERHMARVRWDDYEVLLQLDSIKGIAYEEGKRITDEEESQELVQKAWEYWANDSFWLNAPNKVFDPGTERKIVEQENGSPALLITYTSGGVTPGDSYLWLLDENQRPKAWKLWVNIIPVGGVEFSWEGWQSLESGAQIATLHQGLLDIEIENVKSGAHVEELTGEDSFAQLY
ncbi:hypothetical protein PZB74_04735 [Porifericola rhodea]|uniref:hypothetical protein n=1 Tax=Porifericola rhodea TaxID=930972 RepID=UPI002665A9A8|nr:hypothetical protein [Porifericola rhodea]WKN32649.1 hypothetical protein PZB74_04735 [Porifericola rhodea]